jgi:hypothetical protein
MRQTNPLITLREVGEKRRGLPQVRLEWWGSLQQSHTRLLDIDQLAYGPPTDGRPNIGESEWIGFEAHERNIGAVAEPNSALPLLADPYPSSAMASMSIDLCVCFDAEYQLCRRRLSGRIKEGQRRARL